ncbi:hypothetical protein HGRIS_009899 [Hohenbuehelia grisea]|uniref:Uncharacterized protein n=1 Tax=Hohenbuehelia grisea TaxID=104357 RepID=A0ABR3J2U6_9AGAR
MAPLGEEPITSFFQRVSKGSSSRTRESAKRKCDNQERAEANPKHSKTDRMPSTHTPVRRSQAQRLLTDFVGDASPTSSKSPSTRSRRATAHPQSQTAEKSRRRTPIQCSSSSEDIIDLTMSVEGTFSDDVTSVPLHPTSRGALPKADSSTSYHALELSATRRGHASSHPDENTLQPFKAVAKTGSASMHGGHSGFPHIPYNVRAPSFSRTPSRDSSLESLAPFKSLGFEEERDSTPDEYDFVPSSQPDEGEDLLPSQYFVPSSQTQLLKDVFPLPKPKSPSSPVRSSQSSSVPDSRFAEEVIPSSQTQFWTFRESDPEPLPSNNHEEVIPSSQTQAWDANGCTPSTEPIPAPHSVCGDIDTHPPSRTLRLDIPSSLRHPITHDASEIVPTSQLTCEQELSMSMTPFQLRAPPTYASAVPLHESSSETVGTSSSTSASLRPGSPAVPDFSEASQSSLQSSAYEGDTETTPHRPRVTSKMHSDQSPTEPQEGSSSPHTHTSPPSSGSPKGSSTQMPIVSQDFEFSLGSDTDVGGTQIIRNFCEMFADGRKSPEVLSLSQL